MTTESPQLSAQFTQFTDSERRLHLFLVSDSTGETLSSVAKASMSQFPDVTAVNHVSFMTRSHSHIDKALNAAAETGGVILYTLVNAELRKHMDDGAALRKVPVINVLDPVIHSLAAYLGLPARRVPGRQHMLDTEYFRRIEAMNFALTHDDGQNPRGLFDADVVLVGVSRSSKTPTSIYLANRGIRAGNIPVVPECPLPVELSEVKGLVVGLTTSSERLLQIRRHRLLSIGQPDPTDYVDIEAVEAELTYARRLFARNGWPVIDISRRSIEETSAAILNLYYDRISPT